ncbi:MAG: sigma-70 family RNA polymerase sigma factor [Bryobacteraceae bacterium]
MSLSGRSLADGWPDDRLIEECLRGNEEAWSALIDKYKNLIYSIPLKYGLSRQDAGEIFQQVCLGLLAGLHQLKDSRSLAGWLISITSHACFQWTRRERRYGPINEQAGREQASPPADMPDALLREVEQEQMLLEAVENIPARCRQLIDMLFFEIPPLSYKEAAQRLKIATGSVGFIRMRCLLRLRSL